MNPDLHLIGWLRKLMLDWELDLEKLSKISHVAPSVLDRYLKLNSSEVDALPSIPLELESAVPLIGVFRRIQATYPEAKDQNTWLNRENSVFDGNRPIDILSMSAEHVAYVSYAVESGINLQKKES